MEVYRITFEPMECTSVMLIGVPGWVRSNILEDDLVGCITTDVATRTLKMHVANWRTDKWVIIDTEIESVRIDSILLRMHLSSH